MKTRLVAALCAVAVAPFAALAAPSIPPKAPPPKAADGDRPMRYEPDTNHDGFLSRSEALAMADQRFKWMDANGDGKLTPGEHPDRPDRDHDHDRGPPPGGPGPQAGGPPPPGMGEGGPGGPGGPGKGKWRERREHFREQMGERRDERQKDLFAEYDANHDGALSLTEFRARASKMYDAQDGNKDGKVKLPEHRGPGRMGPPPGGPGMGPPPPKG